MDEVLATALTGLDTLASENPELHKHALLYLYYLVLFRRSEEKQKPLRHLLQTHTHNKEVENIIMTGAEALIQQGKAEGEIQTKREVLIGLLGHRLGDIPKTITNKILVIGSRSRLNSLLKQAATADTLDDIDWN